MAGYQSHCSDCLLQVCKDEEEGSDSNHIGVEILGVHHSHAVACGMVIPEVEVVFGGVCDVVVENRDSALFVKWLGVCTVAIWLVLPCTDY